MAKGPLVLAFLGVALALLGTQVTKRILETSKSHFDGSFEAVAPALWRQGYHWVTMKGLFGVDVYVFLIKTEGGYILVDTGAPGPAAAEVLLSGIDTVLKGAKLKLIILTHGHPDHAGSLAEVAGAHLGAQVLFHADEAPYLLGQKAYGDISADSIAYKLFMSSNPKSNFSAAVPASRALLLQGEAGDVADAKGPAGKNAQWLPSRDVLQWQHVPGHAPGQVALIHKPSQSLITADTIAHMAAEVGGAPKPSLPPSIFTWNTSQSRLDALTLANLPFKRAYPSHDSSTGLSKEAFEAFAASLQV